MKIKRKKHDIVFSELVRNRANWKCEYSGEATQSLDCCHIMGRRALGLRWHPCNALAMSRKHHIWFTQHPFDFRDFCIDKFGEERIAELRLVSTETVKWLPKAREDIYQHMKNELELQGMGDDFLAHPLMHEFGGQD